MDTSASLSSKKGIVPFGRAAGFKNVLYICGQDTHAGADALFDAFAALPGLRTERMLAELADDKTLSVVIWERRSMRPASTLLH